MNAEDWNAQVVHFLFSVAITLLVSIIVHAYITQYDNDVCWGDFIFLNHFRYPPYLAVDITGDINHFALLFFEAIIPLND
jgi:hypothetical protein